MRRSNIRLFLDAANHPTAVLIPVTLLLVSVHLFALPCVDESLSIWAGCWASDWSDVARRAEATPHLPTYFWLARALGILAGGEEGVRYGSILAGIATVVLSFFVLRRLTSRSLLPITTATSLGSAFLFVWPYACGRPYAWLTLLLVIALWGCVLLEQGRWTLGLPVVAMASGFATHMSSMTLPTACVLLSVTAWRAYGNAPPRAWVLAALISALTFLPAVLEAVSIAGPWISLGSGDLPKAAGGRFWTAGWPPDTQFLQLGIAPTVAGVIVLGRRRGWLVEAPHPSLDDRALLTLAGVSCVLPLITLGLYVVSDLRLFRPEYFMFQAIAATILVAVLAASYRRLDLRFHACLGLMLSVPLTTAYVSSEFPLLSGYGEFVRRYEERMDALAHVVQHAEPDELVIVVSSWPESHGPRWYEDDALRSYLLADALRVPGFARLNAYPAPPGPYSTHSRWGEWSTRDVDAAERIWFVTSPWFGDIWRKDRPSESWALGQLRALGFEPVSDSRAPASVGELLLLARRPLDGGDGHGDPVARASEDTARPARSAATRRPEPSGRPSGEGPAVRGHPASSSR